MTTEAELANVAHDWLERVRGCTVHQEVECGSRRCDLVGRRQAPEGRIIAVECKLALGADVWNQCLHWTAGYAHEVWAAVRRARRRSEAFAIRQRCFRGSGIGILEVAGDTARVLAPAAVFGFKNAALAGFLHPAQVVRGLAGSNHGGYSTPYGRFLQALRAYVEAHQGCTVRAAFEHARSVERGYTIRTLLKNLLASGPERDRRLAGLRVEQGRPLRESRLYVDDLKEVF